MISAIANQPNIFKRQKVSEHKEHNTSAINATQNNIEVPKLDDTTLQKVGTQVENTQNLQKFDRPTTSQRFKDALRSSPVKKVTKTPVQEESSK
jgi:hypothetical protein